MSPFVFAVFALLVLILVSGGYVFTVACVRRKELAWLVEEEIKKTTYGKYYEYMTAADRWLKEHRAEAISVMSNDGLKLQGLWIPAQNPKGTVLLAHGYRSTFLADFGAAYEFYHENNMNLLVPYQRSHGKSQGKYITFGIKESRDMLKWIQYHNQQFGMQPMILSGISMGASTVLYLADKDIPENVKGIIADCGFTSPKEILSSVFKAVTHLPAAPSLIAADLFARLFAGFSFNEMDTRKTLAASKLPVLMIHGADDGFVPCAMTQEGYAACTSEKQLLIFEGADHGVSFLQDPRRYTNAVMLFIKDKIAEFNE